MNDQETTKLSDIRKRQEQDHAAKVRKLFEDHPEIAATAIIIDHESGILLTPEDMSMRDLVGILEMAKHARMMTPQG